MLRLFAHFWLILSLLVAPLQFAMADLSVADMGTICCAYTDGHNNSGEEANASSEHDLCDNSSECSKQCKTDCATSVYSSLVLPDENGAVVNGFNNSYASKFINIFDSLVGQTELRPPKSLHS